MNEDEEQYHDTGYRLAERQSHDELTSYVTLADNSNTQEQN